MLNVPVETLDDGARWVRGLDGRAALIRPCDHHAPTKREPTQEQCNCNTSYNHYYILSSVLVSIGGRVRARLPRLGLWLATIASTQWTKVVVEWRRIHTHRHEFLLQRR